VVHILPDGYGYDVVKGPPLLPDGDPIDLPAEAGTTTPSRRARERQST
jgi:hypothetical protein